MSPEQFLQFANLLPEAMLLVTGDGVIHAANRSAGKRLAIPPREISGRQLAEFFPDSSSSVSSFLRNCSGSGGLVPGSLTLRLPDGHPVVCRAEGAVVHPCRQESPALILLRVIPRTEAPTQFGILTERIQELNREIARRRRVEQELREQRQWLQVTLSSIGDGVIATDAVGDVLFMNPRAQFLTGWSQEEAHGRPLSTIFRIVNHHTREPVDNPVAQVLREGRTVGLANDTVLISKDGTEWPIADSGAPIRDESGSTLGVVMVFLEISDRKEMEQILRQQAQELLQQNQRKDDYISMLAHELRNPLGAISNAMVVLERAVPNSQAFHRSLAVARRQLQNQTRMVEDLLDVSRINRGSFQLRIETTDLALLCRQTVEDHRPAIESAGLTLQALTPETPLCVKGDCTRLAQVLTNLLTNAGKFTERGGEVIVQLTPRPETCQAELTVRDTGVGIDPELLPHVFEAFTQGEQNLARSHGGLGLGLALVKGLVELHGGSVCVESPGVGKGATFTVLLPAVSELQVGSRDVHSDSSSQLPIHVLIIEDTVDAAETLRDLLEIWGCRVDIALSGHAGLEAARKLQPHVIICDLGLPGMDGYAVARGLRDDAATWSAYLIALTGYGGEEDRKRSIEAGFDAHLAKPVNVDQLLRTLHSVAQEHGRAVIDPGG